MAEPAGNAAPSPDYERIVIATYAPALQQAGVAALVLDHELKIMSAHGAVERCLGTAAPPPIPSPLLSYLPHAVHEQFRSACEALRRGWITHTALEMERDDEEGTRFIAFDLTPLVTPVQQAPGVLCIGRDITEQRMATRQSYALISLAAHDLRTPITALKGFAQLALKRLQSGDPTPRLQHLVAHVGMQGERLARLIDVMHDLARIHQGRLRFDAEPLDLAVLAQDAVARRQQRTADRSLRLAVAEPCIVSADRRLMTQAFDLLLDQMIYSTLADHPVDVAVRCTSEGAQVTIRNDGVSLASDTCIPVFKVRSHLGTTRGAGIGLNLSMVKEIVQRHGGQMWLDASGGAGMVCIFSLPLGS